MFGFGQSHGAGWRSSKRVPADVTALVRTLCDCYCTVVDDLSRTGVRLRGDHLPPSGAEVELELGPLAAFGSVIWLAGERCGIAFDVPLSAFDVVLIKRKTGFRSPARLGGDERIGLEQWVSGELR